MSTLVVVDPRVSKNASGVDGAIVADELLIVLRQVLGRSVSYLEPPTKPCTGSPPILQVWRRPVR
jgi:hypothetical protein